MAPTVESIITERFWLELLMNSIDDANANGRNKIPASLDKHDKNKEIRKSKYKTEKNSKKPEWRTNRKKEKKFKLKIQSEWNI